MREVEAETPVIWPSWCYSGTGGAADSGSPLRARAPRRRAPTHNGSALEAAHHNNNNNIGSPLQTGIKSERLSPHNTPDRSSSRSRSVTPSTCSFPGTPPQGAAERGPSPAHPNGPGGQGPLGLGVQSPLGLGVQSPLGGTQTAPQPPHVLARNYSDFMRSLAAKYNNANANGSIFGVPRPLNGLDPLSGLKGPLPPPHPAHLPPQPPATGPAAPQTPVGGVFANYSFAHGGPKAVPAFPSVMDMSSTKALLAIARVANAAKEADSQIKGVKRSPGHSQGNPLSSPLDLSSAGSTIAPAAKKLRISPKHEMNESASPTNWNTYGDGRERSPGIESSQSFSLSIKSDARNGCTDGTKYEKSQCGSVKSEAASPASSGRKSPGSTGRKSPGSSTGRDCGGCCRGEIKRECSAYSEVAGWNVDDVCKFVESIDICAEYSTMFREQRIDGAGLPLLTEDHLTGLLRMKLGPALKLRALLAPRLGCSHCRAPPCKAPAAQSPPPSEES